MDIARAGLYMLIYSVILTIATVYMVAIPVFTQPDPPPLSMDGVDSDWVGWRNSNGDPWVSPAGGRCCAPSTSRTVWLCCNTTSTPRICQVIWRDYRDGRSPDDIDTVRLYMDPMNVYIYVNITNPATYYYRGFNVSLGGNTISVRYYMYWFWGWRISTSVYVNNVDRTRSTSVGTHHSRNVLGLELRIPRSTLSLQDGDTAFSTLTSYRTRRSTVVRDIAEVVTGSGTSTEVMLRVVGGGIVYGFVGSQDNPIPIPEPSVLISCTVLLSLGVILVPVFITHGLKR